jgi:hypothetical protein
MIGGAGTVIASRLNELTEREHPVSNMNDLDLMLLADGESDPASGAGPATPRTAADRAKIEGIREVGALVRGHLELSADDAEDRLAGLWSLVERRLDAEERAEAPAPVPVRARGEQRDGAWSRFVGWLGGHRNQLLTGVVAAGAAAAITVVALPGPTTRTIYKNVPIEIAANGNGPGPGPGPATVQLVRSPAEVESLDVSGGSGAVFTIDDEDGDTTVIWVTPDDVLEGI